MKYLTRRTLECKIQEKSCWHKWFAWRPVTIRVHPDGSEIKVWLKYIRRKGHYNTMPYLPPYWTYEYMEKPND